MTRLEHLKAALGDVPEILQLVLVWMVLASLGGVAVGYGWAVGAAIAGAVLR